MLEDTDQLKVSENDKNLVWKGIFGGLDILKIGLFEAW